MLGNHWKKKTKICQRNRTECIVHYKYERLGDVCFVCGMVTHTKRLCRKTQFKSEWSSQGVGQLLIDWWVKKRVNRFVMRGLGIKASISWKIATIRNFLKAYLVARWRKVFKGEILGNLLLKGHLFRGQNNWWKNQITRQQRLNATLLLGLQTRSYMGLILMNVKEGVG